MKRAQDVDEYIFNAPSGLQPKLKQLRQTIKDCAPDALEKISYGIPYWGYKGRLAYFKYNKTHIGLYINPPITELFKEDLKNYSTSTGTVRFPLDQTLPIPLIKKLIKTRVEMNEQKK